MKIKAFIVSVVSVLILVAPAFAEEYISIFDMGGSLINSFAAGLSENQRVAFIEVDPNGDIWIGKSDNGHSVNQFNPNDRVVRFSPAGSQLQVVKGPTRMQSAIGFDSNFNLYIGAIPDGGALGDEYIYVFDQDGTYSTAFGLADLNDSVRDIEITANDRIFAVTRNTMMLKEFNTSGNQLNSLQVNNFFGSHMALNGAETRLWCFQGYNGPGENVIAEYDLNFAPQFSFGLNPIGEPSFEGLEVLSSGNLLALEGDTGATFYEFATDGSVVDTFTLPELTSASVFTLDNQGNIVVVHSNSILQPTSPIPTMNEMGILMLSILMAAAAFYFIRREQQSL